MQLKRILQIARLSFCFALALAPCAEAARITLLISDANRIYSLISQGIRENFKGEVQEIILSETSRDVAESIARFNPDLAVGVGNTAAVLLKKKLPNVPLLASGVISQTAPGAFDRTPGVSLNFPPSSYLRLIKDSLPRVKKVGFIFDPAKNPEIAAELKAAAGTLDLQAEIQPAEQEKEIASALQALQEKKVEVFLMTYDPLIMNPQSFRYLVDFSINSKIALVVPSKTLLKNGGSLSLEPDYVDLGRQTAALAGRMLKEGPAGFKGPLEFPAREEIGINLKMSSVLNLSLSDSLQLKATYIYR